MDDGMGRRTLSIAAAMVTAARAQWEQMGMTPPVDVLDAFSSAALSAAGVLMGHPNPRVAELESQLAEAAAGRDATRADMQALNGSKHMRQLRRFLKATASHRGWMGALSVRAGGVDVVVDYAALRAIVADIERIGGEV